MQKSSFSSEARDKILALFSRWLFQKISKSMQKGTFPTNLRTFEGLKTKGAKNGHPFESCFQISSIFWAQNMSLINFGHPVGLSHPTKSICDYHLF